jgi:hypothetical protein
MLVALGTGVVLAALYFLVVSAQKTTVADYANKIDAAQEKLEKAERWLRMAPGIQDRLNGCRTELEAKQEQMAPVDKFKWFYNTLEPFLAQHRVQLVDITREPEIGDVGVLPKFPYQTATFGVKLSARYHDFGLFLADFENKFPYMRVRNLELEPESGSKTAGSEGRVQKAASKVENLAITMRVVTLIKPSTSL